MESISSESYKLIEEISDQGNEKYVDLVNLFREFNYPVTLKWSKKIGKEAYEKGFIDPLEFFHIFANKVWTVVVGPKQRRTAIKVYLDNGWEEVEEKSTLLISEVKNWSEESSDDKKVKEAIDKFIDIAGCGPRITSFFLRMLLPSKFSTLDVHTVKALKNLGFKDLEENAGEYDGKSYLKYNQLLKEIGKKYRIESEDGESRQMWSSEVDMALYTFDKKGGREESSDTEIQKDIEKIMSKMEEIKEGAREVAEKKEVKDRGHSKLVRSSAENLEKDMEEYKKEGNLEGMINRWLRAINMRKKETGHDKRKIQASIKTYAWLKEFDKKTLEDEEEQIRRIGRKHGLF